jgi:3-deoxy-D-manno-octulosonate 8-phosphate phosphatase KdsC-like HAD superfamily phosphatase
MKPSKTLIVVVDGTMTEPEILVKNMQIEVEEFKILTDIVVIDIEECPVTLSRSCNTHRPYFYLLNKRVYLFK